MLAVHFGAGNIGRGFIGQLLHDSLYEIVFVEVDEKVVDSINKTNSYKMYIIDEDNKEILINNVSALSPITNEDKIIEKIANADLITTSVCVDNFNKIAGTLAKGLKKRLEENKDPVDILACENAFYASSQLKDILLTKIDEEDLEKVAIFSNVAVDRIALCEEENGVKIPYVQNSFELVIEDGKLSKNHQKIQGADYVADLNMYLERKLYVFNCGHAAAAYIGFNQNLKTIYETLQVPANYQLVKNTMLESSRAMTCKYSFTMAEMEEYIEKILKRISHEALQDEVIRVGRSPIRKLSKTDRLVGPMELCLFYGLPANHLMKIIALGYNFTDETDPQAIEVQNYIRQYGIKKSIEHFSGIDDKSIVDQIAHIYQNLINS